MKIVLFVAVGFVLLLANVLYLRSIYRTFFDSGLPEVISPFQYLGVEDKDGGKGLAMAQMLAARLVSLQREVNEAVDALREVGPPGKGGPTVIPPSPDQTQPIQLNARAINVPKVELKVSGVDVSGLFAWAYRGLAEGRAIRVTVHSPAGAKTFAVAAHLDAPDLDDLWLTDVDANELAVVEQVALDILRQHTVGAKRIPEAAGLDRKEFGRLITALRKVASLNHRLQHGAEPTQQEYIEVVAELEPLIARTPRWRLLIELAAKAAENGRELGKALDFSERQLKLLDEETKHGRTLSDQEQKERAALKERITKLKGAVQPKAPPAAVAQADVTVEYPLNLLGVPRGAVLQGAPRVAVLGGTPLPEQRKALGGKVEELSGPDETDAANALREHTGAVAAVVRKAAPSATLVFAKMRSTDGNVAYGDVLAALERLLSTRPDVLVIPLRIEEIGPESAFADVLARVADMTVIVVAAGNQGPDQPAQFDNRALEGRILVADAVDAEGRPAPFASRSEKVVWAPGVGIPVTALDPAGKLVRQRQSGTSYSAALAAGVAAWLKGERPNLTSARVIELLRTTSRSLTPGGPKVLQLDAALKASAD